MPKDFPQTLRSLRLSKRLVMEEARRQKFGMEYLKDFDVAAAMRRCGYPEVSVKNDAARYLERPSVIAEVEKAKVKMNEETKLTVIEIIEKLRRVAQKAETDGDYAASIKALELLGKHLVMFTEKIEKDVSVRNPFFSGDSDEAIKRDIERLKSIAAPLLVDEDGRTKETIQ